MARFTVLEPGKVQKALHMHQATKGGSAVLTNREDTHENFMPGTHVEVLTKHQDGGHMVCGTIIGAAPNTPDTYIVEYHPGLDNGHHSGNELRVIDGDVSCHRS